MSNLKDNLQYGTKQYPVNAEVTSGLWRRCEPILKPKQLVSRFLKGIDLSLFETGDLKDRINLAINEAELALKTTITREKYKEKHPFDQNLYRKFIHMNANNRPIISMEKLAIVSSNNIDIFTVPADWIEAARFYQGQINVVPLTVVGATGIAQGSPTGAAGLVFIAAMMGGVRWVPSYWEIEYTAGLSNEEGQVPIVVNNLIGAITSIHILSELAALREHTSISVSHDGISQSSSTLGPQQYRLRIEELEKLKAEMIDQIRGTFASKFFVSNI